MTWSPTLTPSLSSSEVPRSRHRYRSDMHNAIVDHGDLQAVALEDDGFGWHQY